jgi:hypothetical protein
VHKKGKEHSATNDEVFLIRKLEKCQSEENKRMVTRRFLIPKSVLKTSLSLSPLPLQRQRAILSLPSSRQHSLSSPFSTSSSSLSSPQAEKRKERRHSLLRSLDTVFGFGQAVQSTSSSRPVSPLQFKFLGQIYRHSLEQRETNERQKSSGFES